MDPRTAFEAGLSFCRTTRLQQIGDGTRGGAVAAAVVAASFSETRPTRRNDNTHLHKNTSVVAAAPDAATLVSSVEVLHTLLLLALVDSRVDPRLSVLRGVLQLMYGYSCSAEGRCLRNISYRRKEDM